MEPLGSFPGRCSLWMVTVDWGCCLLWAVEARCRGMFALWWNYFNLVESTEHARPVCYSNWTDTCRVVCLCAYSVAGKTWGKNKNCWHFFRSSSWGCSNYSTVTVKLRVIISRASIDRYQPSLKPRCLIDLCNIIQGSGWHTDRNCYSI